ncbi:unnamed protein product [Pleuronectes platessa]|uniref:Uncharacterized protein n=1 Tax=Pleuronectes platessa TaxID=8262 RepID=A0A9N7UYR6_PLEPL|nr:unnamed protein product [Pleuronectes platessa]
MSRRVKESQSAACLPKRLDSRRGEQIWRPSLHHAMAVIQLSLTLLCFQKKATVNTQPSSRNLIDKSGGKNPTIATNVNNNERRWRRRLREEGVQARALLLRCSLSPLLSPSGTNLLLSCNSLHAFFIHGHRSSGLTPFPRPRG